MPAMEWLPGVALTTLPNIGGFIVSLTMRKSIDTWYNKLVKPKWTPPNKAFGPVWFTLYGCMGYASYLVYRDGGGFQGEASKALAIYGAQLALNYSWVPAFFGFQKIGLGAVILTSVLGTAVATTATFYPINHTASYLFFPYLAWLTLATALNWNIYFNNPPKGNTD